MTEQRKPTSFLHEDLRHLLHNAIGVAAMAGQGIALTDKRFDDDAVIDQHQTEFETAMRVADAQASALTQTVMQTITAWFSSQAPGRTQPVKIEDLTAVVMPICIINAVTLALAAMYAMGRGWETPRDHTEERAQLCLQMVREVHQDILLATLTEIAGGICAHFLRPGGAGLHCQEDTPHVTH